MTMIPAAGVKPKAFSADTAEALAEKLGAWLSTANVELWGLPQYRTGMTDVGTPSHTAMVFYQERGKPSDPPTD